MVDAVSIVGRRVSSGAVFRAAAFLPAAEEGGVHGSGGSLANEAGYDEKLLQVGEIDVVVMRGARRN